jgi:hypothetical protein
MSSYGPPPQIPHPTVTGDPLTPRPDRSQVNLSFLFKSEFECLTMSQFVLLQGSQTSQRTMVLWGGSPRVGQPSTWSSPPLVGFWVPLPLCQASTMPPPQSG